MNKFVKELIEENIDYIEQHKFLDLYKKLNSDVLVMNRHIKDLYDILSSVGIDTSDDRMLLFQQLCRDICANAIRRGNDSIQSVIRHGLDGQGLYGYTVPEVVDYIVRHQEELNIRLKKINPTYHPVDDYLVYDL